MRKERGFTLIELLIVVAIIGIIAAIAIPNLLNAINRGRQKRTMADMRSIATAVETYSVDFNFYPKAINAAALATELDTYLTPTYMRDVPIDGWRTAFAFYSDAAGVEYTIWSSAKGAVFTAPTHGRNTTDFDSDIVYYSGQFAQWPEGIQVD